MCTSAAGEKIVVIGAGNVASHLAPALDALEGMSVVQVYSRNIANSRRLAERLAEADAIDDLGRIASDADIYLISLADNAMGEVAEKLKGKRSNALWLHTSGSVPASVLSELSPRHGVFYPLQTFSRDVSLDIPAIPLFIEGSDAATEAQIRALGERIFNRVIHADSDLRRKMHIAAVFACNFTNRLWAIADELLAAESLGLEVLHPLLQETLRKAMTAHPASVQTGPAARGDDKVMQAHMRMLPPQLREIYSLLSDSIIRGHEQHQLQP